jgi:tetratricopeptide (TPR) repeat protein
MEEYVAELIRAEAELKGPRPEEWLDRLEAEHAELQAALAWCLEHDAERGRELAGAVWPFWLQRGHVDEGRERLSRLLESGGATVARAKALYGAGTLAFIQGDEQMARPLHEESLAIARAADDQPVVADALIGLARCALLRADHAGMQRLSEESLQTARAAGDRKREATALHHVVEALRRQGEYEAARPLYHESLALHRELGDRRGVALELHNLGNLERLTGDPRAAGELFSESLALCRELGNSRTGAYCLLGLGNVAAAEGEPERAARLLSAAEGLLAQSGAALDPDYRDEYERSLETAREALGEAAFEEARAAGRSLGIDA